MIFLDYSPEVKIGPEKEENTIPPETDLEGKAVSKVFAVVTFRCGACQVPVFLCFLRMHFLFAGFVRT